MDIPIDVAPGDECHWDVRWSRGGAGRVTVVDRLGRPVLEGPADVVSALAYALYRRVDSITWLAELDRRNGVATLERNREGLEATRAALRLIGEDPDAVIAFVGEEAAHGFAFAELSSRAAAERLHPSRANGWGCRVTVTGPDDVHRAMGHGR